MECYHLEIHLYQLFLCWFVLQLVCVLIHFLKCDVFQSFRLCHWFMDVYDINAQLFLEQM